MNKIKQQWEGNKMFWLFAFGNLTGCIITTFIIVALGHFR